VSVRPYFGNYNRVGAAFQHKSHVERWLPCKQPNAEEWVCRGKEDVSVNKVSMNGYSPLKAFGSPSSLALPPNLLRVFVDKRDLVHR
jgi:hypothetical protein